MKIYVVTTGEYSDYQIRGVFTTREKAEAAVPLFGDGYNRGNIEEHEADAVPDHPQGMLAFFVKMDWEGNSEVDGLPVEGFNELDLTDSSEVWIQTWAKDRKHAVKIANERRIKWLLENESNQP